MSKTREIKSKIKNIKNTQKITNAMELVSVSKMRKTQEAMLNARPFIEAISQMFGHLTKSNCLDYSHHFLEPRIPQKIGLLVVGTDRGLCGGLNIRLFKQCWQQIKQWRKNINGCVVKVATIGRKAKLFMGEKLGLEIIASSDRLSDKPAITDVLGVMQVLFDAYEKKELDHIYIGSNHFVNTMQHEPEMKQLLPIRHDVLVNQTYSTKYNNYLFEPNLKSILDLLLERYVESLAYHSVIENIACEHAARMIAMKSATDNARQMVDRLQLHYNKERQALITKEISEIVAGAGAL